MYYQTLVKNIFNDIHHFFKGNQDIALADLIDNYQEEPLFLALIGNLDQAVTVNYHVAMTECYAFYKKYCGRLLAEEEWDLVILDIQEFNKKWENDWCKGVILALLEVLDQEDKAQRADGQEPEYGDLDEAGIDDDLEDGETELTEDGKLQEMETAA